MTDTKKVRIKCVDTLNNIAYVRHTPQRGWACTLSNGIPASLFYAGILGDKLACEFDLEDATTPEELLAAIQSHGSRRTTYTIV